MFSSDRWPSRKYPAQCVPIEYDNRPVLLYVTVCTKGRAPILAHQDVFATLVTAWKSAEAWLVGRFVIMPDHIHLFCAPTSHDFSVYRWVQFWKASAARCWPRAAEHPIWQIGCWDTQLRSGDSYASKWEYVRANPVRAGLVKDADAWAFQGELNYLVWSD